MDKSKNLKKSQKMGKLQMSLIFAMVVVMLVSGIFIAKIQASAGIDSTVSQTNSSRIEQVQSDVLSDIKSLGEEQLELQKQSRAVDNIQADRATRVLEATNEQIDTFASDPQTALDNLSDVWTDDEYSLFNDILQNFFENYGVSKEDNLSSRWFWDNRVKVDVYFAVSVGIFVGTVTTLILKAQIMAIVADIFAMCTAVAGVVGAAIGVAIGAIIGTGVAKVFDYIASKIGLGNFMYDLFNLSLWVLGINTSFSFNVFGLILKGLNAMGGNFIPGTNVAPQGMYPFSIK